MQAIYVRQSVDKKDSISIETQIEKCREKLHAQEKFTVFQDKGLSGKSMDNRPAFQQMMIQVRQNTISRIIVYKFDRLTRSLLDLLNMRKEFEKHHVELISCEEPINTTDESGNLFLNILMSFAESEREVIQKRMKDNYYARGEKGLYLGGYAPFGYDKVSIKVCGKKTSTFLENEKESVWVKQIYADYLSGKSLGGIARYLNDHRIPTRKEKPWSSTGVARVIRNPIYVKANADVYRYLAALGGHMNNSIEEYVAQRGCVVYGSIANRQGSKFVDLSNDYVSLGLHTGMIDADIWLKAQQIIRQKQQHSNGGSGHLTWLQGMVQCRCGYSCYVKRCQRKEKEYRYFYCRGRQTGACQYFRSLLPVSKVEEAVQEALLQRISEVKEIPIEKPIQDTPEILQYKIQAAHIEENIENLVNQAAQSSHITHQYLNQAIENLDRNKQKILNKISVLKLKNDSFQKGTHALGEIERNWAVYPLDLKKTIAKEMIEKIIVDMRQIHIIFY